MSDIFVAFPSVTKNKTVIFGKNSDRPPSEVQEVVYSTGSQHAPGSKVKCTFMEIDEAEETYNAILSKPSWCWGAEMGANDRGLCVGCTSVWTKLCHLGEHAEKLIGVDFVRLALERAKSAKEGVEVITSLLEKHGQGGQNTNDVNFGQWTYNNSFLVVDTTEAWVLDTAGQFWAAKKFTSGIHNISSALSISTEIDLTSPGLTEAAISGGYWKAEQGALDFTQAFSAEFTGLSLAETQLPSNRVKRGKELMEKVVDKGNFTLENMIEILRDEEGSINFAGDILTVGSQVSMLTDPASESPDSHWFTGTPNTSVSVFKPFIFCPDVNIGDVTVAPSVDKHHKLYDAHQKKRTMMEDKTPPGEKLRGIMMILERQCLIDIQDYLQNFSKDLVDESRDLFKDVAESEVKFYR
ncbi:secernin-3-like [Mizuhopecten yessoensis]|uniref:Secernin-3 n=1 Tax=Mizuhopecten yessoensis TaxID=6573 RepID=A0A210Q161_MIZYE|nr:secernin-3-like [Mizuhopecten yessoensis]OWF42481.1 Secernin-3 [Mizuhopecten yessoensis]